MSSETEVAPEPVRKRSLYRGDPGMWSWVLHRITGVTIFFFLFVHVLDTAVIRIDPNKYSEIIDTYKTAIGSYKYGEGAARAVLICIFLSIFCLAYFRIVSKLSAGDKR